MNWLQFAVQWLHVLLGILWFGYAMSAYFLIYPATVKLSEATQRELNYDMAKIAARVFSVVALLVLLLGIVRGTVFGPVRSFDVLFGTPYGLTFLVALIVTLGLIVNGVRFLGPAFEGVRDAPDLSAAAARVRQLARYDLAGFAVVFTCMILMRFGL